MIDDLAAQILTNQIRRADGDGFTFWARTLGIDCILCLLNDTEDGLRATDPQDPSLPDALAWISAERLRAHRFAQECGGSAEQQDHYAWTHKPGDAPIGWETAFTWPGDAAEYQIRHLHAGAM